MAKRPPLPQPIRPLPPGVIERLLTGIALFAVLVICASAYVVHGVTEEVVRDGKLVAHSYQLDIELDQLQLAMLDAESGQRGYILVGKSAYLEPYQTGRFRATLELATLRALTHDVPDQAVALEKLEPLITARLEYFSNTIQMREEKGVEAARHAVEADSGKVTGDAIGELIQSMRANEQAQLKTHLAAQSAASDRVLVVAGATLGLLAVLALGFWWVLRREFGVRRRLEESLVETAINDESTGALNRREFERLMGQEWAFRMRYRTPLTILIMEIDNFSAVSDGHGLKAGDLVLREIARRLRGRLRSTEHLARYGGQQFSLLVPQSLTNGMQLATQLTQFIASDPFQIPGREKDSPASLHITISVGVADASDVDSVADLMQAADQALRASRAAGGNRAEAFNASEKRDTDKAQGTTSGAREH